MIKRTNDMLENYKVLRARELVKENAQKEKDIIEENKLIDKRNAIMSVSENREAIRKNKSLMVESVKNTALGTALKAIYISALEASTLTDNGIALAESVVDEYIKENGGASAILNKLGNKTYLMGRLKQICEDAADAEVNADEDDVDAASEAREKEFDDLENEEDVQKAIELIRNRIADAEQEFIKNNNEDKKKIDELIGRISDNVKAVTDTDSDEAADDMEDDIDSTDDEAVPDDMDTEDASGETEEDISADTDEEISDKDVADTDADDANDDGIADVPKDAEGSDTDSEDSPENTDVAEDDEAVPDDMDDDNIGTKETPDEAEKTEEIEDDKVRIQKFLQAKGYSDGEIEGIMGNLAPGKEEDEDISDVDPDDESDGDSKEEEDEYKSDEEIPDEEKDEDPVKKEQELIIRRKVQAIREARPRSIFEHYTRVFASKIFAETALRESYVTEDGSKTDMGGVIEGAKVLYGFLETVNTLQLENVTPKFIEEVLKEI